MDVAAMTLQSFALRLFVATTAAGLLFSLAAFNVLISPTPAAAAPFTCSLSTSFRIPTKAQLIAEYGYPVPGTSMYAGEFPSPLNFFAGVDSRCLRNLTKGTYAYRASITVGTQLESGWPEDVSEYPQETDSSFAVFPVHTVYNGTTTHDLDQLGYPRGMWEAIALTQLRPGNAGALNPQGTSYSELTELCVGERCTFKSEHAGFFFDPSGGGDFGIELDINDACLPITPASTDDMLWCRSSTTTTALDYYFHPGLAGARFTVAATFLFEPIMTWRR